MTPTEFTVASCVYHRDKAKSAAHRSLTKTQRDRAHSSCTPLSLAPLKVFWKHRLPLVCQSLSACTRGHFHLGGTYSSKREATLGLCPDTEMPRVQDKHKFQVAAQHPLHFSLGGLASCPGSLKQSKARLEGKPGCQRSETFHICWEHTEQNDHGMESKHSTFITCPLTLGPPSVPALSPPSFHPVPQT